MKKLIIFLFILAMTMPGFSQTRFYNLPEISSFLSIPSDSLIFLMGTKSSGSWAAGKGHWDDLVTALRDSLLTGEDVVVTSTTGDGSGLTGIGTGTGGVINTGSTTIGADSDGDNVGVIALQINSVTKFSVANDGDIGKTQAILIRYGLDSVRSRADLPSLMTGIS